MLKVQSLDHELGWVFSTRAGDLPHAWGVLFEYRRDYPSQEHRMVNVDDYGKVTIVPDDIEALELLAEIRAADQRTDDQHVSRL